MSALPRTQVLNSSTFKAPPLEDKSLCLPDFYDWQARNSPNHPFFLYGDGPEKIRAIPWAEAVRGIHRAAHLVASRVSPGDAAAALEGRPAVVATLAATGLYLTLFSVESMSTPLTTFSDTVTYVTTEVGILRAGFSVFPISPRNSPEAVAHLLKKTGSNYLLVGSEPMPQKLADAALELLRADGHPGIPFSHMPHYEDLYPRDDSDGEFENYPTVKFDPGAPSLILHSSGQHVADLIWKKSN
jgi:acyl-CoA synthetase (AMP-forming)/AMP-acid ligase II